MKILAGATSGLVGSSMDSKSLHALGWKPFFERQLKSPDTDCFLVGRVSGHFGSQVHLLTENGEQKVASQLADSCGDIAVGDWVLVESGSYRFLKRLDRLTELSRKAAGEVVERQLIAANIDTLFIVSSCNQEFNLSRLERYLALALEAGATPVVVLTKSDLCSSPHPFRQAAERLHPGLLVETLDARDARQAAVLTEWCGVGQTVALLGSSGVGKSTLANTMGVGNLETAEIRENDSKGRHTTTARSLHRTAAGGWLVDTPGMRELQLTECADGVAELFDDVLQFASQCRFRDCRHLEDEGCAVVAAVAAGELEQRRLTNYLKLQSEQARNSQTLMERRQTSRERGRMFRTIMANKQKLRELR